MKTVIVLAIEFKAPLECGNMVESQDHYPDSLVKAIELAIAKWDKEHNDKIEESNTSYKIEY